MAGLDHLAADNLNRFRRSVTSAVIRVVSGLELERRSPDPARFKVRSIKPGQETGVP